MKYKLISFASVCGFVLLWWLITDGLGIANVALLPSPLTVFRSFLAKLHNPNPDGATLGVHIIASLKVVGIGYFSGVLLGIPFGIALGWYKKLDMAITPLFDIIRTIPPIAWIPLFILWLGIGLLAKGTIVFLTVFIASTLNAHTGIRSVNQVHLWVAETLGASNWQMLWKIGIPTAIPMICTGLKLAFNTAWTSLVGAELLGATRGLGYMMQMGRNYCRSDIVMVGMLVIGAIGFVLSTGLDYLENCLTRGKY